MMSKYIIVHVVLYRPCCKLNSGHHRPNRIQYNYYMELLHPFQEEKQEQDEEPLLDYFAILSAQHYLMGLIHEHDNWGTPIF